MSICIPPDIFIASRLAASTSARPLRNLHTTKPALAALSQHLKANIVDKRRFKRDAAEAQRRPHVVLGTRKGEESKWENCDLAKILVTSEEIEATPPLPFTAPKDTSDIVVPKNINFGLGEREQHMIFAALPALTAERRLTVAADKETSGERTLQPAFITEANKQVEFVEAYKANMLARLIDLRNANAQGIAFENRRRCIAAFSEPGKPDDSGRPEVQGALSCSPSHYVPTQLDSDCSCLAHDANSESLGTLDEM